MATGKALRRAQAALSRARGELNNMKRAEGLPALADHWSDFLVQFNRAITMLGVACKGTVAGDWQKNLAVLRDSDDLLKYLHQARNADEHGVDDVTVIARGIGIGPKTGNALYIDSLVVDRGRVVMGPQLTAQAKIIFSPGEVRLKPVKNRGVIYPVPKEHLGKPLGDATPISAAEMGMSFLEFKLQELIKILN